MNNRLILKSSPKIFQNYKSEVPAKTILNSKSFLANIGINLNKLKYSSHTIKDEKFSIYVSALTYDNIFISSGKGLSYLLAEASAYSEAVERVAVGISPLIPFANEPAYFQKRQDLLGYTVGKQSKIKNAVDVKRFFRFFPSVPTKKLKMVKLCQCWASAFSLRDDRYKKIPHLLAGYISSSNGCAAGNTLEEAISQAFCEVCERYSLSEHMLKRLPAPTIDPDSIEDENVHSAIELFNSMNIDVEIKDLTLGNKIPVVGVLFTNQNLAREKNTIRKKLFFKTLNVGSHLDLSHAILRCFSEKIQVENGNQDRLMYHREIKVLDDYFSQKEREEIVKRVSGKKHLLPMLSLSKSFDDFSYLDKTKRKIPLSKLDSHKTKDFLEDIKIMKGISKNNDWDSLVVDYSTPQLPLKVVRVVIPSVSDTLRCRHPFPARTTNIFKAVSISLADEIKKSRKLIDIFEENLLDEVVQLSPQTLKEDYRSAESILILLGLYLLSKDKKKSAKIAELMGQYLPPLTTLLKNN